MSYVINTFGLNLATLAYLGCFSRGVRSGQSKLTCSFRAGVHTLAEQNKMRCGLVENMSFVHNSHLIFSVTYPDI